MSARGPRFEAKQKGDVLYWTGTPCKNGHIAWRETGCGKCTECRRESDRRRYAENTESKIKKSQNYYMKNAEAQRAKRRDRYAANPEPERSIARQKSSIWRAQNPQKLLEHAILKKKYKLAHPQKTAALVAKRRAAKKSRTPSWLTPDDFWMIEEAYELAAKRKSITGFAWHVDHVIPLQGKMVSGLHVPWNLQVIPWCENVSKGNKFVADDSEARR